MRNMTEHGLFKRRITRLGRVLGAIPVAFALAGCASFPNSGPRMGQLFSAKPDPQMPLDVVVLSPENITSYGLAPVRDLPASTRFPASAERYTIAPGDIVNVNVYGYQYGSAAGTTNQSGGLFKSVFDGGNSFDQLLVSSDGTITLPYVNKFHIAGETTSQAEYAIAADFASTESIDEPAVQVSVLSTSAMVHVSGDVHSPGDFVLIDGPETVLDAINKAGGPDQSALQSVVVLRRGGKVFAMPMEHLLLGGGDMPLQPGDDIVVQSQPANFIAMGAVNHAGSFPLLARNVSLLDALGQIGGLVDSQADPTGVFVFRQASAAPQPQKPTVFVLDFSRPSALFLADQFAIQPEDAIYVTNAPLYQAGKVISILAGTGSLIRSSTAYANPVGG